MNWKTLEKDIFKILNDKPYSKKIERIKAERIVNLVRERQRIFTLGVPEKEFKSWVNEYDRLILENGCVDKINLIRDKFERCYVSNQSEEYEEIKEMAELNVRKQFNQHLTKDEEERRNELNKLYGYNYHQHWLI